MENINKICIVGGGNLGISCAVDISQRKNVTLLTSKADILQTTLIKYDTDTYEELEGQGITITSDYHKAYENADMVIVTLPAFCIRDFANKIIEYNPKIIIFMPGFGGKEFFMDKMKAKGCIIAGFDRSLFICRLDTPTRVKASKKNQIRLAALGNENIELLCEIVGNIINTKCIPIKNYLNVTFTPSNPILHTSRLYSMFKNSNFLSKFPKMIKFYAEWTNESSDLLLKMDKELHNICDAICDIDLSDVIPLSVYYESDTVEKLTKKITTIQSWHNMNSPMIEKNGYFYIDSTSRYFEEDFRFGLFILLEFAKIYKVEVPYMTKVFEWYLSISGNTFSNNELIISLDKIHELYY